MPGYIYRIAPNQIIVAAPWNLPARTGACSTTPWRAPHYESPLTQIQLFFNGVGSNPVLMAVSPQLPGLMSRDFPGFQTHSDYPDGFARNADGTVNGPANPAALGSTLTVYVTGLGAPHPDASPGSVVQAAISWTPSAPEYTYWTRYTKSNGFLQYTPEMFQTVLASVTAIAQDTVQIPTSKQDVGGTTDPVTGVTRAPFALTPYSPAVMGITPPPPSIVGVYIH